MLIGTMNHPDHDLIDEIRWMAEMGLGFIDLTLEPPKAGSWQVDTKAVRTALARHGLQVVGHTPYYLPLASPIEELRRAAVEELRRCLRAFSEIGARWMNVHPDRFAPFQDRRYFISRNIESLRELLPDSEKYGVGIMLENLPGEFNSAAQMRELLDPVPELGLHLDFGHANLQVPHSTADEILNEFGHRLRHVHLHDNHGGQQDLHLPLGAGALDLEAVARSLKRCGYDGTLTLEVFTRDKHFLAYSRDVWSKLWKSVPAERVSQPGALSSA
jgi:sugar phosphate isomerase/epimerase